MLVSEVHSMIVNVSALGASIAVTGTYASNIALIVKLDCTVDGIVHPQLSAHLENMYPDSAVATTSVPPIEIVLSEMVIEVPASTSIVSRLTVP